MGKIQTSLVLVLVAPMLVNGLALNDKVQLTDIKVLTLSYGEMTTATGRRVLSKPQLKCVGGNAKGFFTPRVVQCYNMGSDGNNVQWECKTGMKNEYKFGKITINCEGYDYPRDPFVLNGSCGFEYTLYFTNEWDSNKWIFLLIMFGSIILVIMVCFSLKSSDDSFDGAYQRLRTSRHPCSYDM